MTTTAEYYRKVREILWPLLLTRVDTTEPLTPQMRKRATDEQKAAMQLLRLPTGDAPKAIVHHVEAWAKHLQAGQEHYGRAETLGLFDSPEEPQERTEPGLIGTFVGGFFKTLAAEAFGIKSSSKGSPSPVGPTQAQLDSHQKKAKRWKEERDRLEAALERVGADHVRDYRARDYFQLSRWTGEEEALPTLRVMGPTDKMLREQLATLPGGKQLSVIELYPRSAEYFAVNGAANEGFAFHYLDRVTGESSHSKQEDFSLADALNIAVQFCEHPEGWGKLVEWEEEQG